MDNLRIYNDGKIEPYKNKVIEISKNYEDKNLCNCSNYKSYYDALNKKKDENFEYINNKLDIKNL